MRRLLLLSCALLALPACDSSTYDNGYDDGYYDGQGSGTTTAGARFVDFSLAATSYGVSADNRTAGYETDDIDSGTIRAAVERSLAAAGDGSLVMLYIRSNLVNIDFLGDSEPYSALPLSRSFDEIVLAQGPNGTTTTIPVVGYTASYEFSFDNADLYFDVVSSAASTDFGSNPTSFFDAVIPQRRALDGTSQGLSPLVFRLVTVPATAAKRGVDMTNYAAVVQAYGLPN